MNVGSLSMEGMFSYQIGYLWIHGQEEELQHLFLYVFQTYFQ